MFVYYNRNPNNEIIGDCVIRAISTALGIDYYKVLNMLYKNSNYFNCDMIVKDCYEKLLYDLGYKKYYANDKTVEQVAKDFSDKKLVVRVPGHAVACLYGDVYDIWDSSYELVDCFWIIE